MCKFEELLEELNRSDMEQITAGYGWSVVECVGNEVYEDDVLYDFLDFFGAEIESFGFGYAVIKADGKYYEVICEYRTNRFGNDLPNETVLFFDKIKESRTKKLHIAMSYIYAGDTEIDIPRELLNGKSEKEQYKIAFEYAKEHIDKIPVAKNIEYIPLSDNFDMDDISFE